MKSLQLVAGNSVESTGPGGRQAKRLQPGPWFDL